MLFNSFAYAVFLPVVFAVYWRMKDGNRWVLLLFASYFFYMCSGPKYGLLIFVVTVVSYMAGRLFERYGDGRKRKLILSASIFVCMGVVFFFKYFNFFGDIF